jgi:hypothetical protein
MALPSRLRIWQLVRMKLISCFVNKQLFVRRAVLTYSNASSFVLLTTVLELPLAMMLVAVVLLITDRKLLGKRKRGGRVEGGGCRVGGAMGRSPAEASPLAWVRYRAEFYLPAPLDSFAFVRFLALFLFPSFPELYHTSPYSDFRVYLSGLHKCPWFA